MYMHTSHIFSRMSCSKISKANKQLTFEKKKRILKNTKVGHFTKRSSRVYTVFFYAQMESYTRHLAFLI